jgi:glycosyltransferase involved in cell wall biosynthesis
MSTDTARDAAPAVSIVIPSYNCEAWIGETLASVLAQTMRSFELLVVDDGSSDRTRDIVRNCGDARVRLIEQSNARVCRARNRGIEEARAPLVCFLDHDDVWYPHKLQRQCELMAQHPEVGVVYSSWVVWRRPGPGLPYPAPSSYPIHETPDDTVPEYSGWVHHQFLLDCHMLTSSSMFRREVFDKVGTFDESLPFSEDWDLWLRAAREFQFMQLRRPTTLYRMHEAQGSEIHRPVDYCTMLLERTAAEHGLCSRDGRCITREQFNRQLALYHAAFGRGELESGRLDSAAAAYRRAWAYHRLGWKYPVYLLAMALGWRGKALP